MTDKDDDDEKKKERIKKIKKTLPEFDPHIALRVEDFVAYSPEHTYIFRPTGSIWTAAGVNSRVPPLVKSETEIIMATSIIDARYPVEQIIWAPGEPTDVRGKLLRPEGGWIIRPGARAFNRYYPPTIIPQQGSIQPWLDLAYSLYGEEYIQLYVIPWFAFKVQFPGKKINHALVFGGKPGIGKDSFTDPLRYCVGPWNWSNVNPTALMGSFNEYAQSVILYVNEAHDTGEVNQYQMYEHMKELITAPPDTIRCNPKYGSVIYVVNVLGVIYTTNHRTNSLYLPVTDRRHLVLWSEREKENYPNYYWNDLYGWYATGGREAIAYYLLHYDLSQFDPNAPPFKTEAFYDMVNATRTPEDAEMMDAIEALNHPKVVTVRKLIGAASVAFADWLTDRRNARKLPHRFDECGYVALRNPGAPTEGVWRIGGERMTVYMKKGMTVSEGCAEVERLNQEAEEKKKHGPPF